MNKETLLNIKNNFNFLIDNRIRIIENKEAVRSIGSMPFHKLKNLFEGMSKQLFESGRRDLIGRYIKTIKSSPSLSAMYYINESVNKGKVEEGVDATLFLSESIGLVKRKTAPLGVLRKVVKESAVALALSSDDINGLSEGKNPVINKSLDYLMMNEKKQSNIGKYLQNMTTVSNFINENRTKVGTVDESVEGVKFTDLLSGDSDEWLNRVSEDIMLATLGGRDKAQLFEEYKKACIESLNEDMENADDVETKARLSGMKLQLENKKYNPDTVLDDLLNLSELSYTLGE